MLLEVKSLSYAVRDRKPLSRVDLGVAEQEIHALLGANGAGKTELANVIMGCAGYAQPETPHLVLDGRALLSRQSVPGVDIHCEEGGDAVAIAIASAEPIVKVSHPQAMVTHEAAVGTVDQKQLETLMAHGLTPEEAVDVVVAGLLK